VKSISEDSEKAAAPSAADKRPQPRARRNDRSAKNAKWVESLRSSDVNRLWTELHRIVSHHPLVRASRSAGLLVEEGHGAAYTDLTQELLVQLLSKNRFEHYRARVAVTALGGPHPRCYPGDAARQFG
jgi:hypothetical protein